MYPEPISIDSSKSLSIHGINSILKKGERKKKKLYMTDKGNSQNKTVKHEITQIFKPKSKCFDYKIHS